LLYDKALSGFFTVAMETELDKRADQAPAIMKVNRMPISL
jgi:hypothetical protein